jgi:tripartite ATP-independent transporter DctP family solute receptor
MKLMKASICACAVAFVATLGAAVIAPAAAQDKTIRFAHHHPVGSILDNAAKKFAEVANGGGAGLKVALFPAAQMGQERELADAVHYGTVDMSLVSSSFFNKHVPALGFEFMPFLFKDADHVQRALGTDGPVTQEVRKQLAAKSNVHLLGYLDFGFRDFATRTKQISKPEDLTNMKMRAPEVWTWMRMYELLGAKPTPITWGEVYTALQSGVADGLDAATANIWDMKFYEVTKFVTKAGVIDTSMMLTMNRKLHESLSPAQQALVAKAARDGLSAGNKEAKELAEKAYGLLREKGIVVNEIDPTPLARTIQPMYEEFVKKNGGKEFFDLVRSARDR